YCRLNTLIDLYLFNAWIALDVKNSIARQQIIIELLRATDMQNRIGRFIKLTNFPEGQTYGPEFRQITCAKRPAILEIKFIGQARQQFRGVTKIVARVESFCVVGNAGGIFDVVNLVTESLQADNVVHMLPNHARDRAGAHEAHYDDALALHCEENTERSIPNAQCRMQKSFL